MPRNLQVLIVDDHPIVAMGFQVLMKRNSDFEVSDIASTAAEAKELVRDQPEKYDVAIIDLGLPDNCGLELVKEIHHINKDLKCLVVSGADEKIYAVRVLKAGARGYLMKDRSMASLESAVETVLSGGVYLSSLMTSRMMEAVTSGAGSTLEEDRLSDRELEVYRLIGCGKTSREIAGQLGISIRTVDTHRTHIKERLGLKDAAELTYRAVCWVERNLTLAR